MAVNHAPFAFCRDCLSVQADKARRCAACGSPRLVRHEELAALAIGHVDCDAFYAAVEKRDNPSLKDKPVIIGGGRRGVVSTACYVARINGVRSAMPMFKALAACPEAVVIKPNMEKYAAVGRQVREMMLALTPLVEPISIDEAFLDLSGTQRLHGAPPALVLARFAARLEAEIGITASVGLSYCKFLAKVASDMNKPRGFSVIGRAETVDFLAPKPVTLIWGIGKAFAATLERDGIRTIGQLQRMELGDLMRRYGTMGSRLYHLSRGNDERAVKPDHEAKSVSAETTFNTDIADLAELTSILRAQAEKVSSRLKKADLAGRTVVLKLKTADFKIRTRNRQLGDATRLADRIFRTGLDLLRKETDGTRYRLLGIGVTDLLTGDGADPPDLVDIQARKRALAEGAFDKVREKFGRAALETGYTFGRNVRPQREEDG
jgi:DNA polymerase IV